MNVSQTHRTQLYIASCLALVVTSLSFGIRAGILNALGREFELTNDQLASITSTAFWGFPLAILVGGRLVEVVKVKFLLSLTFLLHLLGIVLTIFASGYMSLWISTLMIGIANGLVEAVCNPLIAQLYPETKTTKLNHFHLWFPGGIVIGTLIVFLFNQLGLPWQYQLATMLLPLALYGYFFFRLHVPFKRMATSQAGASHITAFFHPLFLLMVVLMMGTATTELFTGQWIDVLLRSVTENSIVILMISTGVMVIGRGFAKPVVGKLSSLGVLTLSAILASLGIWLLSSSQGGMLYVSAVVFGMGVCYFWPTMIGYVAENFPKTGSLGMAIIGAAGMFAVSIYTHLMGGYYDRLILDHLPQGVDLASVQSADPKSIFGMLYAQAKVVASPQILRVTLVIPIVLAVVFGVLFLTSKRRKKIA